MAITFVGSNHTHSTSTSLPTNLALPASAQNDLVVVIWADDTTDPVPLTTPGYTQIATATHPTVLLRMQMFFKFMGATPDTSVSFAPTGGVTRVLVAAALVFRGVHVHLNPFDIYVPTIVTGTSPTKAGPITPFLNNDLIVLAACGVPESGHGIGSVSGYLPSPSVQDDNVITVGACYQILHGGAFVPVTPGQWSTWTGGSLARFIAATITFKEAFEAGVTVTKSNVALGGKTVTLREITPVSKAQVGYTGKVIATPGASTDIIFVDRYKAVLTGKIVNVVDVTGAVTVTSASVLCRGGSVNPREVGFEDVPYLTVKGLGSEVFMETR